MAFTFGVTASLAANIASAQATPAPGSWPPSRPSPYSWPSKSSPAPAAPWSPSPHRPTPVEQRQRPTARGRTQPTTTHTLAQPTNAAANIAGATGQRRTHAEPATDHRDGHRRQSGRTPRGHPGREHRHSGHPTRGVATYRPATPVRPAANGPHLTGHRPRATIVAINAHRPLPGWLNTKQRRQRSQHVRSTAPLPQQVRQIMGHCTARTYAELSCNSTSIGWIQGLLAAFLNWQRSPGAALAEIERGLAARALGMPRRTGFTLPSDPATSARERQTPSRRMSRSGCRPDAARGHGGTGNSGARHASSRDG